MKTAIVIFAIVALAAAAPKPFKLGFRNLYKYPVKELKARPVPRIIGGQEASPHSIPYQGFLEVYSGNEGWYCGASLASDSYVITAGHCGDGGQEAHVILGAHKPQETESSQVVIVSTQIKVHEDYDSEELNNDIALITLPAPVALNDNIQPVTLPSRADANNNFVGSRGRVSGWGLTNGFDDYLSEVLNYVDVEIISNRDCEEYFGDLLSSIVCTSGDSRVGSCNGDSGGPLIVNGVQIGVVSFGIIFCLPGYPSAFTRLPSFLDWIAANSNIQIK